MRMTKIKGYAYHIYTNKKDIGRDFRRMFVVITKNMIRFTYARRMKFGRRLSS